uniref:Piwi domain-containing protein n=1 Tax=Steinernema glaseri TaxID=37863 RepID=A0A1I7Y662_9BILA
RLHDSAHLQNVATTVEPQMLQLKGREIKAPTLMYAQGHKEPARNGKWTAPGRGPRFVKPARLVNWTCMMVTTERNQENTMKNFLQQFENECRKRGMQVEKPQEPYVLPPGDFKGQMEEFMQGALNDFKLDFVLCIQDNPIHEHKFLKYLERKYGLITQDVATNTVYRCLQRGAATLENIVQKTNVKLGGLNYGLEMKSPSGKSDVLDPTTMFVGLGMCHSKPPKPDATGKEPVRPASVVGFAANVLAQSFAFIGDYYYQAADRDEKIFSIVPIV